MDDRARNTKNHIKKRKKDIEARITAPAVDGDISNEVAEERHQKQMQGSVMKKSSVGVTVYSVMMYVALWLLLISAVVLFMLPLMANGNGSYSIDKYGRPGNTLVEFLSTPSPIAIILLIIAVFYFSCFLHSLTRLNGIGHQRNTKLLKSLSRISFWLAPTILLLLLMSALLLIPGGWGVLVIYVIVWSLGVSIGALFDFSNSFISYAGYWLFVVTILFIISTMMFYYKITNEKVNVRKKKIIGIIHLVSLVLIILFSYLMCFAHGQLKNKHSHLQNAATSIENALKETGEAPTEDKMDIKHPDITYEKINQTQGKLCVNGLTSQINFTIKVDRALTRGRLHDSMFFAWSGASCNIFSTNE